MSKVAILLWLLAIGISSTAMFLTATSYTAARAQAAAEHARLQQVALHAQEMVTLREAAPPWANRPRADTALAPRASAVVASCGLPASVLSNVSPEAQSTVGDGPFKASRQRATLTLTSVTLPQVGRVLDAWRIAEPDWVITSVDLSPQRSTTITPGGDLPLRAVIVVETVFLHNPQTGGTP